MSAQSTDDENNRSPLKVSKPADGYKGSSTRPTQAIAADYYRDDPGVGAGTSGPDSPSTAVYDGQSGG